ncbi:PAS domain S-box protein [Polyangium jinanense]|uniref:histidine kinase n=1 Tax=Polyangium jinanense TaxID=2829994 RepID=A0A9X3X728_9BACT|nr:PAS domain S-box protein [Polyangium jinanense]MDC3957244.1 PAS domain S-box protein [Polyangium jinanense]MDC3982646.1 PAS domain S-box protein [Polyangium jinanense]
MPSLLPASILGRTSPVRALLEAELRAAGFDVLPNEDPGTLGDPSLVVVLDLEGDAPRTALDACRTTRARLDAAALAVATDRDDDAHLRTLVDAGADELFVLPHDAPRLGPRLAAIRRRVETTRRILDDKRDIERRHEYLYEHAPIILHSIDAEGRLVSVSDGWLDALGYERAEVLGRRSVDFMTEASRELALARIPELFQRGVGQGSRYEFVRKDGSLLEVVMTALVERDAAGKSLRTFAVSTDLREVREVERALARANDELHTLLAAFPDNIFRVAEDGTVLEAHFGRRQRRRSVESLPALVGKNLTEILQPLRAPEVLDAIKKVRGTTDVVSLEYETLGTDGAPMFREVRVAALPRGEALILSRDVTELRHSEALLRENETRLRALLDNAPVVLWAVDREGIITFAEGKGLAHLGFRPGELIGTSAFNLPTVPGSSLPQVREPLAGRAYMGEVAIGRVWFEHVSWPLRDASGEVTGALGVSTDITERRRVELALRESERLAQAVFENAPVGIQIFGPDGTSVQMNEAHRNQLGLPSKTYGVGVFNALTDPLHVSTGMDQCFARAYAGEVVEIHGQDVNLDIYGNTWSSSRARLVFDTILFPIRDGAETRAVVAFCRDVTERRHAEARLLLADRLTSLGTMAAGVAHEINNPLSFVLANLEFVAEALRAAPPDADTYEAATQALDEALEGAKRMRAIVRDMGTFSRADGDAAERGPIDVHAVLDKSIRMTHHALRHRTRVTRAFGDVPQVIGNEARLGQVFVNLLANAAQAMPDRPESENEIRLVTRSIDGRVLVEVVDNGVGIPPDRLTRIFDPFFTTKPVGEGMGLGLSVCHSIVTSFGGELLVESTPGTGSIFRVILRPAELTPRSRRGLRPSGRGDRPRVLFVDDEPYVCTAVRRILGRDMDLVCACGSEEALGLVRAGERFDVVLCDLMMPGTSGVALYASLLELDPALECRVGFLTGGACTDEVRSFVGDVGDRLLFKPFEAESFRALVSALASGSMPPRRVG